MKNPRWSKLLSLFLVLAMLVQMMPVMSFADDDDLPPSLRRHRKAPL